MTGRLFCPESALPPQYPANVTVIDVDSLEPDRSLPERPTPEDLRLEWERRNRIEVPDELMERLTDAATLMDEHLEVADAAIQRATELANKCRNEGFHAMSVFSVAKLKELLEADVYAVTNILLDVVELGAKAGPVPPVPRHRF